MLKGSVFVVLNAETVKKIAKYVFVTAHEPDLENVRRHRVVRRPTERVLHPCVAFCGLFALNEDRAKTPLLRQGVDRGLVKLSLLAVQMGEQVGSQFRVEAGDDLVRLKHGGRTVGGAANDASLALNQG